jgi:hypothetical protein
MAQFICGSNDLRRRGDLLIDSSPNSGVSSCREQLTLHVVLHKKEYSLQRNVEVLWLVLLLIPVRRLLRLRIGTSGGLL